MQAGGPRGSGRGALPGRQVRHGGGPGLQGGHHLEALAGQVVADLEGLAGVAPRALHDVAGGSSYGSVARSSEKDAMGGKARVMPPAGPEHRYGRMSGVESPAETSQAEVAAEVLSRASTACW